MKLLVTGATGLLGQHTVKLLRGIMSYEVFTTARSRHYDDGTLTIDLSKSEEVSRQLPQGLHCIIHLAAHVPPVEKNAEMETVLSNNTQATMNLLEFAAKNNVKHFIYGSSIAVYGQNPSERPLTEEDIPSPDNFYALSKLSGEILVNAYAVAYGIHIKILRFSYIYGTGMREKTVLNKFIQLASNDEQIPLINQGRDTLNFIYVKDAAKAILQAIQGDTDGVFNVGSSSSTSIRELAETIKHLLKSKSGIESTEAISTLRVLCLSTDKANKILKWNPQFDLTQGMQDYLQERKSFR